MTMQTESESLKQERKCNMKCACVLAVSTMCISIIAFVIGAIAISKSAPVYAFPYCIGGAMIAGFFTCVSSFVQYRHYNIYSNNEDNVTKENAQQWSCQLCCLCPFVCVALILGLAFSGVWGMVQATSEKRDSNSKELAKINLQYAIASFVLVLVLSVLQVILYCVCHGFKATYSFEHQVQGNDEFYIPINSYTYRSPRRRNETSREYATRLNYLNAARRNQQSTTVEQDYRNLPRLSARGPYATYQSGINNQQSYVHSSNNPFEQRRPAAFSIPIPVLYNGRGRSPTASPSETAPIGNQAQVAFSIPIPELYNGRGRSPTAPPSETAPTGNEANVRTFMDRNRQHNIGLCESPPGYDELAESGLPSYQEVLETGAYQIEYV